MDNLINELDINKVKYLFPPTKNYNKLMISNEGVYSMTPYKCADVMTKIIYDLFDTKDLTIVDATSNVGGNTISFSKVFNKVISIEKNNKTFLILKNNINVYELHNITVYNDDCINKIPNIKEDIDIIFIDPPWGGKSYKKFKFLYLSLSDLNIVEVIKKLSEHTKAIALKIPFNFNFIHFFKNLDYMKFSLYKIHFKYYMLVLTKKFKVINSKKNQIK